MGSKSKTIQTTTETNIQDIDTTNIDLEIVDGVGLADIGGDVRISVSDQGAIEAAENISAGALNLAGDVTAQAIRSNERGLSESLDFGRDIFSDSSDLVAGSIRANQSILEQSLEFGQGLVSKTISTLSGAISKAADATRSDAANTLGTLIKFGSVAAGVIGLAFIVTRARG